jgi:hypothetical protein
MEILWRMEKIALYCSPLEIGDSIVLRLGNVPLSVCLKRILP